MLYKRYKTTYDFKTFKPLQSFGDAIRNGIIMIDIANSKQQEKYKAKEHQHHHQNSTKKHQVQNLRITFFQKNYC